MNKKIGFLLVAFGVALLQGCSAHVTASGGGGDQGGQGPGPQSNFQNLVNGPSLDGTWKSACVQSDRNYGDYEIITLVVSVQNVSRESADYLDPACTKLDTSETETGLVRYDTSSPGGNYGLEYQFNLTGMPPGVTGTYAAYENVRLDGEVLFVSDEIGGTAIPTIALTNTSAPSPAPTVVPSAAPVPVSGGHVGKLGDTVTFTGISDGVAETEVYTNQGYDSEDGQWAIFENIQGPNPDMGYYNSASVWTSAQTTSELQNCILNAGSLQTITVKAGTFQTCMMDDGEDKRWYGDAPILGLVKMVSNDGTYAIELTNYQWGDSQ